MKKILFVLPLLIACAQKNVVRTPQSQSFKIFDAHAHFESDNLSQEPSESLLKEFKESGVVAAVVHLGRVKPKGEIRLKPSPIRFAICAGISPKGESPAEVEARLKRKEYQCLKVYLGYVPKYATDPIYKPFYKLAEKYKVPVVFHTGDTEDKKALVKYAEPLQIDEIAVTYPKVKFVMAHMGNPWFHSAAEVVYKNDNVYVDLSAIMIDDVSKNEAEQLDALITQPIRWVFHFVENPKKFLFGSDWPLSRIKPYVEALQKAIPEKHWEDVFYWNAMEVFFGEKKSTDS